MGHDETGCEQRDKVGSKPYKSHFFPDSGHKRAEVSKRGARVPAEQRYLRCMESARQSRRIYRVS